MKHQLLALATLLALAGVTSLPSTAKACGGFFCNNAQPVNQAAERIIFARNADGTTTAVIQIQYSGPSESFAWMLPVQGSPEIGLSSNIAFQQLQAQTNPNYRMNVTVEGECDDPFFRAGPTADNASFGADGGAASDAASPGLVDVVDSGSVGPYDYIIINVNPTAEDIAEVATEWLNDNEYDVSPLGRDRLVPYLEAGMNLLAFRLRKGRSAGEIRPVTLSFGTGLPSIPIRPTAAAATPDMGIMVWVVGESRAIPANYAHLELNEARINWFRPNSNYNDVVTLAANEAGGQGFVTEFAGEASPLAEVIWSEFMDSRWDGLSGRDWTLDPIGLIQETAGMFSGADGVTETVLAEVPKPEAVAEDDWNASPFNFLWQLETAPDGSIVGFDVESYVARFEREVVAPLRDTAALFMRGRMATRFYTTMSPEEMTMDPVFDFNGSLPSYSNQHVIERIIECNPTVTRQEATWRVAFPDGTIVRGEANNWPLASAEEMPANRRVMRIGNEGDGEVITDNSAMIASIVVANNERFPRRIPGRVAGGGCSTTTASGSGAAGLSLLVMLGLVAVRRRRGA